MTYRSPSIVTGAAACLAILAAVLPPASIAAVDLFRIRQLYSSQDGAYQYIELEETGGKNDEDQFVGLTLTVTSARGVTKTFVFPTNLPNGLTAGKHVLLLSETHANALPH